VKPARLIPVAKSILVKREDFGFELYQPTIGGVGLRSIGFFAASGRFRVVLTTSQCHPTVIAREGGRSSNH
jgi:hypothetical protein